MVSWLFVRYETGSPLDAGQDHQSFKWLAAGLMASFLAPAPSLSRGGRNSLAYQPKGGGGSWRVEAGPPYQYHWPQTSMPAPELVPDM